jgi:hypothetical protein
MGIDCCLTNPSFFASGDPLEIWSHLRRQDPMHWTASSLSIGGFRSLTRCADLSTV